MSDTIWKFPVETTDGHVSIYATQGAKFLYFDTQNDELYIWMQLDPTEPDESFYFTMVGTGFDIPPDGKHVGSCQQPPFVWHLFEED